MYVVDGELNLNSNNIDKRVRFMRIAFISAIHGNSWILKTVLDDIKEKGVTEIYDLSDSFQAPLNFNRAENKDKF